MSDSHEMQASVARGEATSIPTVTEAVQALTAALRPRPVVAQEVRRLSGELVRAATGRSSITPAADRRFRDPAWTQNPLFRGLAAAYLAGSAAVDRLVEDYVESTDDLRSAERARFAADIVTAGLSPTNLLLTNPAGLKRAFDTCGASVLRGARNLVGDVRHNGGLPTTVDRSAFRVGRDLAVTPGVVIKRDDLAELIQYRPATEQVHARPLLVVPPPIGRFYFLDLRPGRSFVSTPFPGTSGLPPVVAQPGPTAGRLGHGRLRGPGAGCARHRVRRR
jgi:polyhydroxyalkanoate synthase